LADQGIGLEATRIGDDGTRPAGHAVQSTQRCYSGGTWTLHQVKGVHDDGLDAALFEIGAIYVTHYAKRGVRQERREAYLAVGQL
jgi:hypothetical protein